MNSGFDCEWIRKMAEVLACEVTEEMSGIKLQRDQTPNAEDERSGMDALYGYVTGEGYQMQLQLLATPEMFSRLAGNIMGGEPTEEEVREYATEFFNVLCGRFISELHASTCMGGRFFPTQYEVPPNLTPLDCGGQKSTLHFVSENREEIVLSWMVYCPRVG